MENPTEAKWEEPTDDTGQPCPRAVDRLGRYRLGRELGRGFSSVVFEAEDLRRRHPVALKVLTFLQNLSPERRGDLSERFAREARAISALSHPNIVVIYEVGHADDGREFIAMERLHGETLRARLQRAGALPPEEAVPITLQVAEALQYAHEHGIIHRDVKPDNVFVLPDGCVKLMDFGVAHVLSDEALTQTGTVVGSPAYMSPEQINGEHLDGRSDVFSLGVMLAEMVVGHKPFDAATIPAVMHRILTRPPQMEAVTPRPLRKIIEKSLSKNRQARFQSAAALADALRRQVLPDLPVWEPTSTVLMPIPTVPDRDLRSASHAARWLMVGVLVALASLGAVSLAAFRPHHTHPVVLGQTLFPQATAATGRIRHIPAYWQRLPGLALPREGRTEETALKPPLLEAVRIVEKPISMRSPLTSTPRLFTQALVSAPKPTAFPLAQAITAVPRKPQLAVSFPVQSTFVSAATPPVATDLKMPVVKIAGFRQEQTFSQPMISSDQTALPADQDSEQINAADALPPSQDTDDAHASTPRLLRHAAPVYPRTAWAAGLEGTTTLRVSVDSVGNVTDAAVLESSGILMLDRAALRAVRKWEYAPAFRDGQTVSSQLTERIVFSR